MQSGHLPKYPIILNWDYPLDEALKSLTAKISRKPGVGHCICCQYSH
jgi:hypothetical protein